MRSTISRFVRSLPPPMLYLSPARPSFQHEQNPGAVVVHVQPVADIRAVAVDGQRFAVECVQDHQRDQFFGELKRSVVVRAVGDERLQIVGVMIRAHEVIGRRLARGVGRVRRVRRVFAEESGRSQRAVHLVGGHVQEAEGRGAAPVRAPPRTVATASSSTNVPTMLVSTNGRGPSIDRSTWVSAARFSTASGRASRNVSAIAARSEMSACTNRTRGSFERLFEVEQAAGVGQLVDDDDAIGRPWPARARTARDCEPMKPAPPVMRKVLIAVYRLYARSLSSYADPSE